MQVEIKSIRVKRRVRKELGDVEGLAESLSRFGQLHPIVLTRKKVLVSGRRRMEAARILGWTTIDAITIASRDAAHLLEMELDENVQRYQLTRDEVEDALARLERLKHPGFLCRVWRTFVRFWQRLFKLEEH
ncbi:MAG: chromosome partitioning protein ParB [Spirochaetes bacterium RIFOXYC1_FULL_54_7]|nr:MAG: chromosome partitioning protein ParB [Spirochaetes bacterium RIFOXYC1_FULL_54_7]